MTLLYSSSAPTGWNSLPLDVKQKFYDIASKGDWSATEAYEHLVPETLKDNPDEVRAWMDGNPDIGVPDRDVSRVEAGGEYSEENTVMENSSDNRSRQDADMTESEYADIEAANARDIQIIEDHYQGDSEAVGFIIEDDFRSTDLGAHDVTQLDVTAAGSPETVSSVVAVADAAASAEVATTATEATVSAAEIAADVALDWLAPAVGAAFAGKAAYESGETSEGKAIRGAAAAGATWAFLVSPLGAPVVTTYVTVKAVQSGIKLWKHFSK